jgi:peroxiredoxin (alkyl hydroperoxide reductase subunit C)
MKYTRFLMIFKGKWVVLFSHPADFTPVCTTEFVAFQKRFEEFKKLNAQLIGLSVDQVFSHIKWVKWIKEKLGVEIEFPIIADDRGDIVRLLGMIHPGKGTNTVRAVFIIDPDGIVRLIIYYPQEIGRNMDEILRALKALQTSDEKGVAIPANWPNNEIIGDNVIIPPARDVKTAKERLEKLRQENSSASIGGFAIRSYKNILYLFLSSYHLFFRDLGWKRHL